MRTLIVLAGVCLLLAAATAKGSSFLPLERARQAVLAHEHAGPQPDAARGGHAQVAYTLRVVACHRESAVRLRCALEIREGGTVELAHAWAFIRHGRVHVRGGQVYEAAGLGTAYHAAGGSR